MKPLLLDTSYLIALEASDDQNHNTVLRHWQNLLKSLPPLVTTSYVFDEVVTFFNSRGHHAKAVEIGNNLMQSASIEFIHVDEALFYESWQYFQKHADKAYPLTDCISFVIMKQRRIKMALTFYRHFVQAGFEKLPEKAA